MSNIDYEAQVKRAYPDAWYLDRKNGKHCIISDKSDLGTPIGNSWIDRQTAWEHAYNTLKQLGKI